MNKSDKVDFYNQGTYGEYPSSDHNYFYSLNDNN